MRWTSTSSAAQRRRKFSCTLARSSPRRSSRFRLSHGAGDTPPRRVEKPWTMAGSSRASEMRRGTPCFVSVRNIMPPFGGTENGRRHQPPPVICHGLAEFAPAGANKVKFIFGGGVYVAENSSRPANVRVRVSGAHVVHRSRPQPAQTIAQRSGCRLKLLRSGTPCRCISSILARCRKGTGRCGRP